jgi:hypothetical protein
MLLVLDIVSYSFFPCYFVQIAANILLFAVAYIIKYKAEHHNYSALLDNAPMDQSLMFGLKSTVDDIHVTGNNNSDENNTCDTTTNNTTNKNQSVENKRTNSDSNSNSNSNSNHKHINIDAIGRIEYDKEIGQVWEQDGSLATASSKYQIKQFDYYEPTISPIHSVKEIV